MDDAQLVELFFRRSEEAVRALAEMYGGVCRRLSVNILKNDQDAEECVNDAYLAVWNAGAARPAAAAAAVPVQDRAKSVH